MTTFLGKVIFPQHLTLSGIIMTYNDYQADRGQTMKVIMRLVRSDEVVCHHNTQPGIKVRNVKYGGGG